VGLISDSPSLEKESTSVSEAGSWVCLWRRRLRTYQARRAARTVATPALNAMPALALVERDVCFSGVKMGFVLFVQLADVDGTDDGVARDEEDEADVDEESGIVIATAPQLPNLLLHPVPQQLEFPPQYPKCEQQSPNVLARQVRLDVAVAPQNPLVLML